MPPALRAQPQYAPVPVSEAEATDADATDAPSPSAGLPKCSRGARVAVALCLLGLGGAVVFAFYETLMPMLEELFRFAGELGPVGAAVFVLVEWASLVCLMPTTPFEIGAGVAFGENLLYATTISTVGKIGGGCCCFLLGRHCFRARANTILEEGGLSLALVSEAFAAPDRICTMLAIQMSLFPFPVKTYGLSLVESVSLPFFAFSTSLSVVPFAYVFARAGYAAREQILAGDRVGEASTGNMALGALGLLCTFLFIGLLTRRLHRRLREAEERLKTCRAGEPGAGHQVEMAPVQQTGREAEAGA